jgi:hypothetical protein
MSLTLARLYLPVVVVVDTDAETRRASPDGMDYTGRRQRAGMDYAEVPPDTLPVELIDGGIGVTYTDGRRVFYHGTPTPVESPHETAPGKEVHVLVTDGNAASGVLLYVNERATEDGILSDSGVGRVLVGAGKRATVFPGVTVEGRELREAIVVDHDALDGRVFVFEEDQFEERSFEVVADAGADG